MLLAGCSRRICNDVANGPRTDAAYACMVGAPVVNVKKELPVFDLLVVKFHLVCEIVQELPRPAALQPQIYMLATIYSGPHSTAANSGCPRVRISSNSMRRRRCSRCSVSLVSAASNHERCNKLGVLRGMTASAIRCLISALPPKAAQ